jgi:hypothetical protein
MGTVATEFAEQPLWQPSTRTRHIRHSTTVKKTSGLRDSRSVSMISWLNSGGIKSMSRSSIEQIHDGDLKYTSHGIDKAD